jgi:DNA-binding MarR family transcriptional regulator
MTETLAGLSPSTHDPGDHDPELTESAEQIAEAVIGMVRQFTALRSRVTGPEGESSPQFLLVKLAHFGPSRASELAERVCADPSTVSRQVAQLVKSGLVERRADPEDGRASILVPTELGLATVDQHVRRRGEVLQPVVADWTPQDRADLVRLVTKYTEGIEAHREELISGMLQHRKETS